jgi:hypothetical protein
MEKGYRFHLLNMTIWILFCDLTLCVLIRPYPLLPLTGGCVVGELNGLLLSRMKMIDAIYTQLVSFF